MYITPPTPPTFLRDLLSRILLGESVEEIISGLTQQHKGYCGEAILRIGVMLGFNPSDPTKRVSLYTMDPKTVRSSPMPPDDIVDALMKDLINTGGGNKIDVAWKEIDTGTFCMCSSKFGTADIKLVGSLDVYPMRAECSRGYLDTMTNDYILLENIKDYVLVYDRSAVEEVARRSRPSNQISKDAIEDGNIMGVHDLNRLCAVIRGVADCCTNESLEGIIRSLISNDRKTLELIFHQFLISLKVQRLIEMGEKTILIAALPRAGKTYIGGYLAKKYDRILVITTRPSETREDWQNIFKNHIQYSTHKYFDMSSSTANCVAEASRAGQKIVVVSK
jgi:hypothetical protein